jgi:hypothetical protein
MLNDMPDGFNMRERTLGAFRLDGSPKPVVGAFAALHEYLRSTGSAPGDLQIDDDPEVGLRYLYRASDAVFVGGKRLDAGEVKIEAGGPAQLFVSWSEPGSVRVWASARMKATLNLPSLAGGPTTIDLEPGSRVLPGTGAPRTGDYAIDGGRFFTQTNGRKDSSSGYGVTNADGIPFWDAFQGHGGVDVLGYPVSRRFVLDGFTVHVSWTTPTGSTTTACQCPRVSTRPASSSERSGRRSNTGSRTCPGRRVDR